ncbi:hypothetical protein RvY_06778 [Ramazzottius varieornatus]|uniref:Selenocysteine-specific elongation factor n=1 Tax=Ramazzottius varieornatus TaxID=947166 RepID=A0A1D1V529_RAMVA|nr:hypothetical protein RvY_06778 [Ramazzottius varieornatus]
MDPPSPLNSLNFNVGVLGHIDSGKTSLCKALSTVASTASFDKNPQSQERGITLDLGFSSFCVAVPPHLQDQVSSRKIAYIQYTLVDCPGHASLIRTIISGAQIMDLMLLIVDVTKGIQTQTAECLVIGEITCGSMIVVLNKTDLLPEDKRHATISKMKARLEKVLQGTKFSGCPIVTASANQDGEKSAIEVKELVEALSAATFVPKRDPSGPMVFSVDHCFTIRGQGSVMTGTMLSGTAKVNDSAEIVSVKEVKKIKSMQMFRQPVTSAMQGDRVGICVPSFDAKLLERGFVTTPNTLQTFHAAIILLQQIPYFKQPIKTRSKFHVTVGHETVMARVSLFTSPTSEFTYTKEYKYLEETPVDTRKAEKENKDESEKCVFALLEFESPVTGRNRSLIIASRLDADIHQNACRLAFHGHILESFTSKDYNLTPLRVYKPKEKQGTVERLQDNSTVIVRNLVKKETDISKFERLRVTLSTGELGFIEGSFGKSGKIKVRIPDGLKDSTVAFLTRGTIKKKGDLDEPCTDSAAATSASNGSGNKSEDSVIQVKLLFKRYIYDLKKQMVQA